MSLILLVEDEADIAAILVALLEEEGFEVAWASDGHIGLELAGQRRPNLVVTDLMMPVMSGLELVTSLADDPQLRSIPVITVSAAAPPEELGDLAAAFLRKPFDFDALLSLIHARLDGPAPA